MSKLQAVLCDVDGTLIDSNAAHAEAWMKTLAHFGIHVDFNEMLHQIGKGGDKVIPAYVPARDLERLQPRIKEHRAGVFHRDYLPNLQPLPHARDLLVRMKENGLRIAVASSTDKEDLAAYKKIAQIEDLTEGDTTSADASSSKPDPDIFQAAIGKLGLSAAHCIALGDTPYDIEAAGKAGVSTIAVCSGGWTREELSGAVAIYEDVADLYRNYDSSPLAR
ncbi:HAD family hydrolase [Terriglobus saanensis]|uniref:HAD-superfamily hydrolase, subfamily IA, variant 3 n=1 Tax=Terriglobus saanensis (strain ATCC BAA-1853 / DSM 23119 / SP1PR4) TaxID=401053 RepID=E8V662_TERSS|nr:HAD family phosphatase [Terriglobus saanensis]ADV84953.1 HAD-superfamily hydrolase, subfamily IA, variant 3 [Terriglobus saanensis SP1PR4]